MNDPPGLVEAAIRPEYVEKKLNQSTHPTHLWFFKVDHITSKIHIHLRLSNGRIQKFHLKQISKYRHVFFLIRIPFHSLKNSSSLWQILIWNVNDLKKHKTFAINYPWFNSKVELF